jgi:16S rRNA processing protein RimM
MKWRGSLNPEELVSIGKIVGTYGYKGTFKVAPLTDFPERFQGLQQVYLNHAGMVRLVTVESAIPRNKVILVTIRGVESKEDALNYRGGLLMVDEKEVYPLPESVYYHFQLRGLEVIDSQHGYLGRLAEVLETGANDVYLVKSPEYGEVLIPAIKDVIQSVDLDQGVMKVSLLPGLLESE